MSPVCGVLCKLHSTMNAEGLEISSHGKEEVDECSTGRRVA